MSLALFASRVSNVILLDLSPQRWRERMSIGEFSARYAICLAKLWDWFDETRKHFLFATFSYSSTRNIRSKMENFRSMQISFRANSWEKLPRKWIVWITFFFPVSISGERIFICYVNNFIEYFFPRYIIEYTWALMN